MISKKDKEYVKLMNGQPLSYVMRACDMGDLGFGEERMYIINGRERETTSLALHLSCPFRLVSQTGEIVFTAYDMYLSYDGERMEGMSWDVRGINLYDKKTKEWMQKNPSLFVKDIKMNNRGDLRIVLSNNDRLEVFVNNSTDEECWRFFEMSSDEDDIKGIARRHLVMTGTGTSYE